MKLRRVIEEMTPQAIQDIYAGMNPDKVYLVQRRVWTYWLLRGILGVTLVLGLIGLVFSFFRA